LGIIDPHKVVRSAFENAISIASLFIITETVVADIPTKDDKSASSQMPPGMGMGGF
jgi:chaperonin GroEL